MDNDTYQDVEPSVISLIDANSVQHTTTVFIKFDKMFGETDNRPRLWYSTTNDLLTSVTGKLPLPDGWDTSYDPVLAVNPYAYGISGRTMYCVGILSTVGATNTAVALWSSPDGVTWSNPPAVIASQSYPLAVDKPFVNVSWNPDSTGNVYVGWVQKNIQPNPPTNLNAAFFRRETQEGGYTHWDSQIAISYDDVMSPSISEDLDGTLSYIWVNYTFGDMRVTRSGYRDHGASFGTHEVIDAGGLLRPQTQINGGVPAASVPTSVFNRVVSRTMVVWHKQVGTTGRTNVYYTFYPCASVCTFWGWEQPTTVADDASATDKFQPSIDYFTDGTVVVNFYDRRMDTTNNLKYDEFAAYINWSGVAKQPNLRITANSSTPTFYTSVDGNGNFIGDYHAIWSDTFSGVQSMLPAFIGFNGTHQGDTWLGRINY